MISGFDPYFIFCVNRQLSRRFLVRLLLSSFKALVLCGGLFAFSTSSVYAATGGGSDNKDTSAKEFIMSCTYGVLAGTLVGAAMLAFEDKPGDNLNKVARGASLGLYAGILLGVYVVYIVPSQQEDPSLYEQPGYPGEGRTLPRPQDRARQSRDSWQLGLFPYLDEAAQPGAGLALAWTL